MLVASRLHKTVSELIASCTASEIADWLDFYALQNGENNQTEDQEAQKRKEIAAKVKGTMNYFLKRQKVEEANR